MVKNAPPRDEPLPLVTRYQLADCLGVFHNTVTKWEREGLPVEERGVGKRASKYSLPACIKWFLAHERARYEQDSGVLSLDTSRAKLAEAQRKRVEQEIRRRDGELIAVAEVVAAVGEMFGVIRSSLLALPASLAAALVAEVQAHPDRPEQRAEAALRERIEAALKDLSEWNPPGAKED